MEYSYSLLPSVKPWSTSSWLEIFGTGMSGLVGSVVETLGYIIGDIRKVFSEQQDIQVENVRLLDRFNTRKPAVGTLYLTATHLIFVDPAGKKETWVLHMHIASVEKLPLTTAGSPLQIRCKTFLCVTFIIPRERDCHDVYTTLLKLSQPGRIGETPRTLEDLYAFHYTNPELTTPKSYGWDFFDLQSEYLRMGVPNENWVLTHINKDYEICDTYPRYLYVPQPASTAVLIGSSRFRSRGRLPVLSYLHSKNRAAICRCSQPLAGFSARCVEDEQMLQAILKANPQSKFMYVVDTRPKQNLSDQSSMWTTLQTMTLINAMANKAAGKGYENENFYSDIKFQFLGIENIHVMRNSLQKLTDVCELKNPSSSAFLNGVENSGWMKHIRSLVETALFIAEAAERGISTLVHCSDGWDRTAQTCSISCLILDPYYRTIQGFQTLIDKEWLSFGHKFTDRCGLLETVDAKEVSPVFTQFIESVWQMKQQFPCAFQFNDRYLLTIHDHVYSCQFGTFIGNCEKDRIDLRLADRTYSLWGYLNQNINDYVNPLFKKEYEITHMILKPDISPQSFTFWRGMYNRFENGVHPRENVMDIVSAMKDHSTSLEDHIKLLEKRVTSICKLLDKPDDTIQRKLDGLVSSESLYTLSAFEGALLDKTSPLDNTDNTVNGENDTKQSDTESGFEDGSSQMGKSLLEESGSLQNSTFLQRSSSTDTLSVEQLLTEINSVSVNWKSFRNVRQCSCSTPFDTFSKKYHCWKCGSVFCTRCIARHVPLLGHYSQRPVPVCKTCYKEIKHSPSLTDFQVLVPQNIQSSEASS
ncbi:myotubularin-related protein 8-like isoform X3 [Lineus longissimus]|uniref:myotubularin-related protein 8-like isoform X3 n=1 Tax=Lineus longissimus TaxID=88925 RepID=UPI00315D8318